VHFSVGGDLFFDAALKTAEVVLEPVNFPVGIHRLLEIAGHDVVATIQSPYLEITSPRKCTAVEDNQEALEFTRHAVRVPMKPFKSRRFECKQADEAPRPGLSSHGARH
jgi:hypothetical protein